MTIEVKVPVLPESVADATIAKWYKQPGDSIERDENLVDLETDKVMLEVPAPKAGTLKKIIKPEGQTVLANDVIAIIEEGESKETAAKEKPSQTEKTIAKPEQAQAAMTESDLNKDLSPAVRRLATEYDIDVGKLKGSGKEGRITKADVTHFISQGTVEHTVATPPTTPTAGERVEKRVPMSRLRARIAQRLLEVTQNTAMLTTFNEVNMQPIMELRTKYKEKFEKEHGVKLGLMSFFVKASIEALKRFPAVNASIDGNDIVYHGYFDIGIAVSTDRGLVVPVIRDANQLSMAGIEKVLGDYAVKARDNKITLDDITGGTFTITNGGVFGSMLATPIINPPQSAILGMHNIVKRSVVENDEIVIRPIMYIALTYDHRIIDGKESVTFLRTIKECLEDPTRLLLEI